MMPASLDLIEAHYPEVAAELLEPLLRFLTVARELMGGDTEMVLIMLVVSIRTKQHPEFEQYTAQQLARGEVPILPSLGANVRSVAAATGIPKETVRRKIRRLVDAGFLVRLKGDFRFSAEGYAAVAPARVALERLALRNYRVVDRLVHRAGEAPAI
jgi:DNA-binding MarR family transcriptional regulator